MQGLPGSSWDEPVSRHRKVALDLALTLAWAIITRQDWTRTMATLFAAIRMEKTNDWSCCAADSLRWRRFNINFSTLGWWWTDKKSGHRPSCVLWALAGHHHG